jgi:hypothetical protein
MSINNTQASAVDGWSLTFDFAPDISSIWNATILSHTGNQYVIVPDSWDSTIAAGGSANFGFIAAPDSTATPTNIQLDGSIVGSGGSGSTSTGSGSTSTGSGSGSTSTGSGSTSTGSGSGSTSTGSGSTSTGSGSSATANASFAFTVTSDWGSGFGGQIVVTNNQSTPISNWTLAFNFDHNITSIWNATVVNQSGNQYLIGPASWDTTIPAGGSVSFGFNGDPGDVVDTPTNYVLTGTSGSSGSGSTSTGTGSGSTSGSGSSSSLTAADITTTATENLPTPIDVLNSAVDSAGYTVTLAATTNPTHGTIATNSSGIVTYTPATNYTGPDSFTYTVSDGAGDTATATVSIDVVPPSSWPAHVFAPYVDMTAWPTYNLVGAAQTAGVKYFNLAFVVADSNNQPSWGGYTSYEIGSTFSNQLLSQIDTIRSMGGNVAISFGGANGTELAQAITNLSQLESAYNSVINTYGVTRIDFDIEGAAVADQASINLRSQALAAIQQQAAAAGRSLQIWFTLPALPTGLTSDGLYVLQSALHYGVHISGVNVMAMDYGDSAAPNPQGNMGTYAIDAATSLHGQLQTLYGSSLSSAQLWNMVGVTPMIGVNDVSDEIFGLTDAQQLLAFAQQTGMGELSMWSLNRDQQAPGGTLTYASSQYSGVLESPYQFATTFEVFTG